MKKTYSYPICKCGSTKENIKSTYCRNCSRMYYERFKVINRCLLKIDQSMYPELIDEDIYNLWRAKLYLFVNKIENRSCMASTQELLIEMITLHNHFCENKIIDIYPVNEQLMIMWNDLRRIKLMDYLTKRKYKKSRSKIKYKI